MDFLKRALFVFMLMSAFSVEAVSQTVRRLETLQSLYIQVYHNDSVLGNATGFVYQSPTRNYLITNWHVVTGRDSDTNKWIGRSLTPNRVLIVHNGKEIGKPEFTFENLIDARGGKLYHEFRKDQQLLDVVALPLKDTLKATIYPVRYDPLIDSLLLQPTIRVFVVGFPRGKSSGNYFPIWKSGLIASEPDFGYDNKPVFLLDFMGQTGMSGSPVYLISDKVLSEANNLEFDPTNSYFIGVFSAILKSTNLGVVWQSKAIHPFLNSLP